MRVEPGRTGAEDTAKGTQPTEKLPLRSQTQTLPISLILAERLKGREPQRYEVNPTMPQVLDPHSKTATVAETIANTESDLPDLTFDDLTDLQHSITALLRAKDRGDDTIQQLATVQKSIKALAVEFGIIAEIYAQQDESLKRHGLKTTIVPLNS